MLTKKASLLLKPDEEILSHLEKEGEFEAEIEQTDVVREKISLAIIPIEEALEKIAACCHKTY